MTEQKKMKMARGTIKENKRKAVACGFVSETMPVTLLLGRGHTQRQIRCCNAILPKDAATSVMRMCVSERVRW